jgi:hypothetical protein
LAINIEWQAQFEELAEQVAKLSKAGCLDAESIAEVMTRIASHPYTLLLVREKGIEATLLVAPPSPLTAGCLVRDHSPSPPPETNEEKE